MYEVINHIDSLSEHDLKEVLYNMNFPLSYFTDEDQAPQKVIAYWLGNLKLYGVMTDIYKKEKNIHFKDSDLVMYSPRQKSIFLSNYIKTKEFLQNINPDVNFSLDKYSTLRFLRPGGILKMLALLGYVDVFDLLRAKEGVVEIKTAWIDNSRTETEFLNQRIAYLEKENKRLLESKYLLEKELNLLRESENIRIERLLESLPYGFKDYYTSQNLRGLPVGLKGLYILFDARGDCLYVGKSKDLKLRLYQHFNSGSHIAYSQKRLHGCAIKEVGDSKLLDELEIQLIKHLNPEHNIRFND